MFLEYLISNFALLCICIGDAEIIDHHVQERRPFRIHQFVKAPRGRIDALKADLRRIIDKVSAEDAPSAGEEAPADAPEQTIKFVL